MIPVLDNTGTATGKSVLEGAELQAAFATIVSAIQAEASGTQAISAGSLPLPTGAATQTTLAAILSALGTPAQAGGAVTVSNTPTVNLGTLNGAATQTTLAAVLAALQAVQAVDTVIKAAAANRGLVAGTTAAQIMAANTNRRGFAIQNQSATAKVYINGTASATADYNSLLVPPGGYYETPPGHTGTGAISIISDTASTPVYAREW